MADMDRLLALIGGHRTNFVIDRNYFIREGIHIDDELNALISDGFMSEELAEECAKTGDIWFCEFTPNDRDGKYEVFAATFQKMVKFLIADMEGYINACAH